MTTTSSAGPPLGTAPQRQSNVLNRAEFLIEAERVIGATAEQASLATVVVINIQQFRDFSIEFGHQATEEALSKIAGRIQSCLREADRLGRLGSSDFALLLPRLRTQGQAIMAINKIQRVCYEPLVMKGRPLRVRLAFGAAIAPSDAITAVAVLARAETALRHAVSQKRESAFYSELKVNDVLPIVGLERNFSLALERHELDSLYQPIIDVESGDVIAAEMLARWEDPEYGSINPEIFFKLAEDSGLLTPLTLWTINKGLRECNDWQSRLPGLSLALNIPPSILCDAHWSASLLDGLQVWGIRPQQLTIEITEKSLLVDPDRALTVLEALHAHGMRIAIDDFGTGYSSLAYLKKLPISELKIDGSFVKNMLVNPADRRIVKSVIDLAHNFELSVVAEGVEDEETLDSLTLMGCHHAQGDLIGSAMSPLALPAWLEQSPWTLNGRRPAQTSSNIRAD